MQNRLSGGIPNDLTSNSPTSLNGFSKNNRTVGKGFQAGILMSIVSIGLLGAIGSRLFYLQIVEGAKLRERAEHNRVRTVAKPPVRGNIYDRKGRLLAGNRLSHSVFVWPQATKRENWLKTRRRLSEVLDIPEAEIESEVIKVSLNSTRRVRIAREISTAQITALQEYQADKEGIDVDIESIRYYPHGELAAHVLGYTGEITPKSLDKKKVEGYRLGDVVGKMGVEATAESTLRGEWGGTQVEVDGAGRLQQFLGQKTSQPGKDVALTLDLDLQKVAEEALGSYKGSIVAMNPNDGAILVMASRPAFDPNKLSGRILPAVWKELQGKDHPFVNRSLQVFPPASTFKVVTATAGLESGKFKPDSILPTYGTLNLGGMVFSDWNRAGFGPVGFTGALQWSSNTFFGQVGQRIGGPTLIEWTRKYGFGQKTGIELPEEAKGLVPDDEWKQKNFKMPWKIGDTINTSIGQGFLQASPLQVAGMFAVPANGGYHVAPHVLKDNQERKNLRTSLNLKPSTVKVLRQGLRDVVSKGTGRVLDSPTLPPVAGKSGTAEAPPGPVHVWFGAYAPADKPEIVVVAFGEHAGGGGGRIAAPMILKVMEAYFNDGKPLPKKEKEK